MKGSNIEVEDVEAEMWRIISVRNVFLITVIIRKADKVSTAIYFSYDLRANIIRTRLIGTNYIIKMIHKYSPLIIRKKK